MKILNSREEKKEYIKKHWNISSGKRITYMLMKYWKIRPIKKNEKSIYEITEEIFS